MRQRKIIGAILVFALAVCALTSCDVIMGGKPEKLVASADEFLKTNPYTVDVRVTYESDDENMASAIASFTGPSMQIKVNGDDFSVIMYLKNGDTQNFTQFVFSGGYVYIQSSDGGKVMESVAGPEEVAAVRESLGAGANVTYEDFEEVDTNGIGKVHVINCTKIKADAIASLTEPLAEMLEVAFENVEVTVHTVSLSIEIEDGKYNVIILDCEYFITTPTDSYSIEMQYSMKFGYDEAVEITPPVYAEAN